MIVGRRVKGESIGPDFTPMIDVVFLLLIFFIVTAQMAKQSRSDVQLPSEAGDKHKDARAAGLIVNILADGTIQVADRVVDLPALRVMAQEAASRDATSSPIIRADFAAPTSLLNGAVETMRSAGFTSFKLSTNPSGSRGGS
ncbi:MAG: biopolymer transporter ExbD [Phycisphaerales bacterium]|nr:biopolymer transporter ExbD [Phycisphaerales bacterium]